MTGGFVASVRRGEADERATSGFGWSCGISDGLDSAGLTCDSVFATDCFATASALEELSTLVSGFDCLGCDFEATFCPVALVLDLG